MRKNDMSMMDIPLALVLLTRLPIPKLPESAFQRQSKAAWAFPLAGLAVTLPACLLGWIALTLGLPSPIVAGVILLVQAMLTGAMHEDGLADTVDGFWGGFTRERRLQIMKDSHIGTYGVLALVFGIGLRWLAIATLIENAGLLPLLAVSGLSRAAMTGVMAALPNARRSGLSQSVGRPSGATSALAIALALILSWLTLGTGTLPLAMTMGFVTLGLCALAKQKIGGQTGDILGATQQVSELTGLLLLLSLL